MTISGRFIVKSTTRFATLLATALALLALGATPAQATPVPSSTLTITDATVTEGDSGTTNLTFHVLLNQNLGTPFTFSIATADGTATAGNDYIAKTLTNQSFTSGQTDYVFTVQVIGDSVFERSEQLFVNITNVSSGAITVADAQGVGSITDNDIVADFYAKLDGQTEFPSTGSQGLGYSHITYNSVAHTLRVQTTFYSLFGTTTASHIHSATTAPFTGNAGVATQTPSFTGFPLGVTSGTNDNTLDLTLASSFNAAYVTANGGVGAAETALIDGIIAGKAYYNIHTTSNPGGEIRGFYIPTPVISLTASTPTNMTVGVYNSSYFMASGGIDVGPYSYTYGVTAGILPGGMNLDVHGTLSGTPTGPGLFNFTVTATNVAGLVGSTNYTLNVSCPAIKLGPTAAFAIAGSNFSLSLLAAGGSAPYTYSNSFGALPNGLTLASDGTLAGIPTTTNTFNFTVAARDNNGCTLYQPVTVTVLPSLPQWDVISLDAQPDAGATSLAVTFSGQGGIPAAGNLWNPATPPAKSVLTDDANYYMVDLSMPATIAGLLDSTGAPTPVTLTFNDDSYVNDAASAPNPANAGYAFATVPTNAVELGLDSFSVGYNFTATFSNLVPNATYNLAVYPGISPGSDMGFSLWKGTGNMIKKTVRASYDPHPLTEDVDFVRFTNVQADATGAIVVYIDPAYPDAKQRNFGGIQIQFVPPPPAPPAIASVSPADGAWFSTATLPVSGTATPGSTNVAKIFYGVNGGPVTNLASGTTNWSFNFPHAGVTNTVTIQACGADGALSEPETRTYIYSGTQPVTIVVNGAGHIWPPQLMGANLTVGKTYTLVAISNDVNSAFVGWTDNQPVEQPGFGIPVGNVTKTFTMTPGLTLTAIFTNNPFVDAAGTYYGLFYEGQTNQQQQGPITRNFNSSGWLRLVVDARWNYSAQIWVNGHPASFSGRFDLNGNATPTGSIIPTGDTDPLTVQLKMNFDDTLGGDISLLGNDGGPFVIWSSSLRAVKTSNGRGNQYLGNYNFVIPGESFRRRQDGPVLASQPPGYGLGTLTVSDLGLVQAAGATADGLTFRTLASGMSASGEFPFFALSQNQTIEGSRNKDYRSLLIGWMQFNPVQNNTVKKATKAAGARNNNLYTVDGDLTWDKLPAPDLYPNGFTIDSHAYGSYYLGFGPQYFDAALTFFSGTSEPNNLLGSLVGGTLSVTDTNFTHVSTYYYQPGELRGRFQYTPMSPVQQSYRAIYLPYQNFLGGYYTGDGQNGLFEINPNTIIIAPTVQ